MTDSINPARLITVGLPGLTLDDSTRTLLDRGVGGVILFSRNVQSPEQLATLTTELKQHADRPLIISIDQEGGRVARLREGFTALPTMRQLGNTGDESLAHSIGQIIGTELRAVGIDVAFAPVLDVDTNPANPVIGDRSLSRDPAVVARMGRAITRGIQSAGVAACGKHFPGHGDTTLDSHHHLPLLPHGMDRLETTELPPFRAAIHAGIAGIMTTHIVFTALDPDRPATLSPTIITGLLRETLGFRGAVFTDCMEMKAIADTTGTVNATLRAVQAGVDQVLISHTHDHANAAIDLLQHAIETGELGHDAVEASIQRLAKLCQSYVQPAQASPDLSALNSPQHRAIATPFKTSPQTPFDPTESPAPRPQ